jgi:hypothetical protein
VNTFQHATIEGAVFSMWSAPDNSIGAVFSVLSAPRNSRFVFSALYVPRVYNAESACSERRLGRLKRDWRIASGVPVECPVGRR